MFVWLQGPSGTGKTTTGRQLAVLCGLPFIDLDEVIEREQGRSLQDIFRSDGEAAFRRMEWNALLAIAGGNSEPKVIALGGGAVIDPAVRAMMKGTGLRITLEVTAQQAIARLESDTPRPLLHEEDPLAAWQKLYNQRRGFYADTDFTIDAGLPAEMVAQTIHAALPELTGPAWSFTSDLAGESSTVAGYRSLFVMMRRLREMADGRQLCIVADAGIVNSYGDYLAKQDGQHEHLLLTVGQGEGEKSLKMVEQLASGMASAGFTRECMVVAIGGGVVTDLGGFLASIYMRGVRVIYIPTTLLAQVDAAIGGKTAVNGAGIRNLLGTFRQPSDVLIWPGFLRTLSGRELRSGFVESLKMGIANSSDLADAVERAMPEILQGEIPGNIDEVIRLSVRAKLDVVERDTHETSLRMSLNLGHTFGHALEAAVPDEYAHGEAVAFGLIAAAGMAYNIGRITSDRMEWIIARALPFTHAGSSVPDLHVLLRAMEGDKKRSGAGFRFILPAEETGVMIYPTTDRELIFAVMERAFARIAEHHRTL